MTFRVYALAILLGCIGTSGYYRRRARREGGVIPRARESLTLKLGRSVVALPLFGGVLAYVINPGWMAWSSANWFLLMVAVVVMVLIHQVVIPLEERELIDKFGDRFREYMARTGRLLPRAGRHHPSVTDAT